MQDRKERLINKLTLLDLDSKSLTQSQKDNHYKEIITLRSVESNNFDAIGYNQLHWATLCNQPVEEINRLIKEERIDVNCGTRMTKPIVSSNFTPLHIAIHIGSEGLANNFLHNGSNQKYKLSRIHPLFGPLSGNDYSTVNEDELNAAKYALQKKNVTFKLFERQLIEQHHNKLVQDQDGYNSILPTNVASFFYYSKKEELQATEKLNKQFLNEPTTLDKLKELKNKYPAVEQNELGEIYSASLAARM